MRLPLRLLTAGLLVLAVVIASGPADRLGAAGPPAVLPRPSDQVDYVFFASDRPVLIRMHLRLGDKPYAAGWDAWINKLFTWYDKDGDGFLTPTEWARVPDSQFLSFQIQGSIGNRSNPTPFANVDTNKDGKISREEFRAYYRNGGLTPLRFANQNQQATQAKGVNDAIYKRLEVATTGKLTQEKLARLQTLVRNLDENEDELLSQQELQLESDNTGVAYATPGGGRRMPLAVAVEPGLIEIRTDGLVPPMPRLAPPPPVAAVKTAREPRGMMGPQGANLTALVQQMLAHYDKGKKSKLSPKDIAFSPTLFAQLDTNHDGFLDVGELVGFFKCEPDLVFRANVGPLTKTTLVSTITGLLGMKGVAAPNRAEVLNAKTQPLARKVKRVNGDNLNFALGDSRFELQANEGQPGFRNGVRQFYLQRYDTLAEKKGYVDKAQEKDNLMDPFLFYLFVHADRNADGKLTRKELEAYLTMIEEGATCFVSVQVEDTGRSLFNILDSNGDGQLSIREMRTAWERVKPLCKDGKGLELKDLPRSLRIVIGQGNTFFRGRATVVAVGPGMASPGQPARGGNLPAWFLKMDLNNDGDISPKEWLGTEEEFRMIDTDGDGLISADEARKYEARRKKEEKKPDPTKPEPKKSLAPR